MYYLTDSDKQLVESNINIFSKVLKNCLKVKGENILIITDSGTEESNLALLLSYGYHCAAKKKGFKTQLLLQDVKKGSCMQIPILLKLLMNYLKRV